jgi:hypothetical protein
MPTLDDVDIAMVQRGDLSRGVTIPGAAVTCGRGSTTGGGRGSRGPGGSGGPSSAPALGKGKGVSARVVHDDNEVSSDEDEPLQARLRSRFPAGGSSSRGRRRGGGNGQEGGRGGCGKRGGWRGLISPRPGAFLRSGRQEGGDAKWLLSTGQTALQGCLETSVCPKVIAPCFVFFLRGSLLQLSVFQTATGA